MLNKVLFVSLLVLGLFFQPSFGSERLQTRIAGGFAATTGQFPWMIVYTYVYTSNGVTSTYQGTGFLYNDDTFITSANALSLCASGTTGFAYQNVTDTNVLANANQRTFVCGTTNSVNQRSGFKAGIYKDDVATVRVNAAFPSGNTIRLATSSPIQSNIDRIYAIGFGESSPGAAPSPVLQYAPINAQRNRVCWDIMVNKSLQNSFTFGDSFCVQGQLDDPRTGFVTDACVLDQGGAIFRTQNILTPQNDFEVIGVINFGTCTTFTPVLASYLFKFNDILGTQRDKPTPTTASPANPLAKWGNFACGDGVVQKGGYEKCDVGGPSADPTVLDNNCCDKWTCQYYAKGTPCGSVNNHTKCLGQPACSKGGSCRTPKKSGNYGCNGKGTKCKQGRCCTLPKPNKKTTCF